MKPEFEISTDAARLDLEVIHGFLRTSYWAEGRARSVVERSIRNSLCFGAYLAERQVAFARVVSDRAVFAYLMDVFVVPEFRGPGDLKGRDASSSRPSRSSRPPRLSTGDKGRSRALCPVRISAVG